MSILPCTAIVPCPAAGRISSVEKYRLIRYSSPSLFRPAAARISASYSPRSSFSSLVITFPLTLLNSASLNSLFAWILLLKEEQPMIPRPSHSSTPFGSTSTSRTSSLGEYRTIGITFDSSIGISFKLCTARSIRPSSSALSSSFTNRPFPPI